MIKLMFGGGDFMYIYVCVCVYFFFLAVLARNFDWVRDRTCDTAVTPAIAVTMPDQNA